MTGLDVTVRRWVRIAALGVVAVVVGGAVLAAATIVAVFAISAFALLTLFGQYNKVAGIEEKKPTRPVPHLPGRRDRDRYDRPKAPLTEDEADEMKDAAETRKRGNKKDADDFIEQLREHYPDRAERITDDVEWLQDKAQEYGVPDSVLRWLL